MRLSFSLGLTDRRSGTSLSSFAINGVEAQIVFDAATGTYKKDAANTNYSGLFTAGGDSLKTQVNSAGELVWAPHNLVTYSEQFDNAAWGKTNVTITADAAIAPNGTTTADKLISGSGQTLNSVTSRLTNALSGSYANTRVTYSVFAKAAEHDSIYLMLNAQQAGFTNYALYRVNINDGSVVGAATAFGDFSDAVGASEDVGGGWRLVSLTATTGASSSLVAFVIEEDSTTNTGDGTSGIYVWGAHLYRSDLGGMADNPDRGDSYVPTTQALLLWMQSALMDRPILR